MLINSEYTVNNELYALCSSIDDNQKNVTRITNCLGRVKIHTVEEFKTTELSEIIERIKRVTGQRMGVKTINTLTEMHR